MKRARMGLSLGLGLLLLRMIELKRNVMLIFSPWLRPGLVFMIGCLMTLILIWKPRQTWKQTMIVVSADLVFTGLLWGVRNLIPTAERLFLFADGLMLILSAAATLLVGSFFL